jgi:hypothetical protein
MVASATFFFCGEEVVIATRNKESITGFATTAGCVQAQVGGLRQSGGCLGRVWHKSPVDK